MKMFVTSLAVAASLAVATPALADVPVALTPSGATESYFAMPVVATSDMLANKCVDLGWTMISSTDTTVVCEVPVSFGSALLSALAGPRYATPPRQYFRFNLAGVEGNTRVQASSWQEIQTAFGQTQRTDLDSSNYHNTVMTFFESNGGVFPMGTTFPNHAQGGFAFEAVDTPEKGLMLTELVQGGAFADAGLRPGDVVVRIAKERTKDFTDVHDAMRKAVKDTTYEVEFYRGGSKDKLSVERRYRPDIDTRLPPRLAEPDIVETTTVIAPMSMADELAKFAKLRDDGIITTEEFEAQKTRLLKQ